MDLSRRDFITAIGGLAATAALAEGADCDPSASASACRSEELQSELITKGTVRRNPSLRKTISHISANPQHLNKETAKWRVLFRRQPKKGKKAMTTGKALDGEPYAGNPHMWIDEGEVAQAAKPRRGSLLYKYTLNHEIH